MQPATLIHDLRRRIVSDEPPERIRNDIRSLILGRIETADPLTDRTKNSLVSAIAALDTASRRRGVELPRSRLSKALLHLQSSMTERGPRSEDRTESCEILDALSRDMLRDAARKLGEGRPAR